MNDRFAFFVVLRQCPRRNCLNIASTESGTTISVENIATAGFVKHGPDFESFSEFPATSMQHGATSAELRCFTLVTRAFGEIVESLLTRNFQTDRFKSWIHDCKRVNGPWFVY